MIDLESIKTSSDLLALAEQDSQLRKVANTGGGEWAGPCPFCGGVDRFRVQPNHQGGGLWMCRQCTGGKWQDVIAYKMQRDSLDFKAACQALGGGDLPTTKTRAAPQEIPAYDAPSDDWQACALEAVKICADNLWKSTGEAALDYLRGRGLQDETIKYFGLGYSPGAKFGSLFVPRGVLIPCQAGGEVWYLKISLLPGDPVKCEKCGKQAPARKPCPTCGAVNKYRGVKGNRTGAIFNADYLEGAELALFCEGEIDAMTAWQELSWFDGLCVVRDGISVVTLGAATNRLDLATWGAYLLGIKCILVTYDPDQAGKKGAAYLLELTDRAHYCPLPEGVKDINDFTQAGGELWPWLKSNLDRLGVLQELGAVG